MAELKQDFVEEIEAKQDIIDSDSEMQITEGGNPIIHQEEIGREMPKEPTFQPAAYFQKILENQKVKDIVLMSAIQAVNEIQTSIFSNLDEAEEKSTTAPKLRKISYGEAKDKLKGKVSGNKEASSALEEAQNEEMKKEHLWRTERDRQKYKEDLLKKEEEAINFSKRMKERQQEIKKREEERQRQLLEKAEQDRASRVKEEQEKNELINKRKKKEAQRRLEEFDQKRKERQKLLELAMRKPQKQKRLYEKMEEKYFNEVEMPELEKRKKEIADKRNLYKPIRKDDLEEHKRRFEDAIRQGEEERLREREKLRQEAEEYMKKAKHQYKSAFTEEVVKKDQESKSSYQVNMEKNKEAYLKKMTYAKIIKESCAPTVSELKALELKRNIEELHHHPKKSRKASPPESTRANGRTLTGGRIGPKRGASMSHKDDSESMLPPKPRTMRKPKKIVEEPPIPKPREKPIDYLSEIRKNRESHHSTHPDYETLLKKDSLSPSEKYQLVKARVDLMDENAKRREQLLNVKGDLARDENSGVEISDMSKSEEEGKATEEDTELS